MIQCIYNNRSNYDISNNNNSEKIYINQHYKNIKNRHTDRQQQRQTYINTQISKHKDRQTDRNTGRHTDRERRRLKRNASQVSAPRPPAPPSFHTEEPSRVCCRTHSEYKGLLLTYVSRDPFSMKRPKDLLVEKLRYL